MPRIDLRSDTVTHPTPAMRRAMAEAELGDDVFGDDPTVNALEERAAAMLGKEAGLFVASGSMGNLVAQLAHLGRGQETIASAESHLVMDEAAGHAVVVGTSVRALPDRADGTLDLDLVAASFRDPEDPHEPLSGLVAIENTHAHSMGQPLGVAYTQAAADVAHAHGVPLHVDGARFFNAVVALGVDPRGPGRAGRFGHLLPQQGARLPDRLDRRRLARLHLARPPRPQARRRRHAPGGGPGGAGPARPLRRTRRDDRPPRG